jgi:uncharacterized protein (DUF924 family)
MPADTTDASPTGVVAFWRNAGPRAWFAKSPAFDAELRSRFLDLHMAASRGELDDWAGTAEGALALLLLLDQFPRNMFRGSAHAFASDPLARAVARRAIEAGLDGQAPVELRPFFYLPFEHSEDPTDQALAVELCETLVPLGDADSVKWAKVHKDIIDRFGRFPHRNACHGRRTTPEEQAFLESGGFKG